MPTSTTLRTTSATQTHRSTPCARRGLKIIQEQVGHRWGSTTALYFGVSGDYRNRVLRHALDHAFGSPTVAPAERN